MRFACGIEYDGTCFAGWQKQEHAHSVQAAVEAALSKVADHPVKTVCAGRTDAGVHATGQVIHFETEAERSIRSWVLGTNSNLPDDVTLTWIRAVDGEFHARFSALARSYRYIILNRDVPSALLRRRTTWRHGVLDEERMRAGAKFLVGEQDFSSFRAIACQAKSPVRTVHRLEVTRRGDYVYLDVEANAFLHHMVRNIAGVLIAVGCGERDPEWVREILEIRDRKQGGVTAPAAGLYLVGVRYPDQYGIAPVAAVPVFA